MINCLFFTLGAAVPFVHVPVIKRIIDAWSSDFVDLVSHKLPKIVVILIVAFVLYRLVKLVTHRLRWLAKRDPVVKSSRSAQLATLASIIETATIGIIAFIAVIHMLQIFHINVAPLLASAGVVGLAIGFGAQTIVHDIINGMLILVENQFDIGDVIKTGGFTGDVEQMSLRRTVLRGSDGAINIVPNSQITTVTNLSRDWSAIQLDIAVDYRENSDRVLALLRDLAQQIIEDPAFASAVQGNPAILGLDNVKGSQAIYPVVFRTQANMQWSLEREFRLRVKKAFQQNRILPGDGGRIFHYPAIPAAAPGVQPKTGS